MHTKISLLVINLLWVSYLNAQDSTKASSFKVSGFADIYYRYDFNNPGSKPYNNLTSFTNSHNSFELGMASIKGEQTIGKAGLVADIGFGKRADEFSYNDGGSSVAIKQLYVTYAPSQKVKLSLGTWATHIGYELADANLNRNYSMSYMFSYGPFFHTGIKAEWAVSEKTTFMLGIANSNDLKYASGLPKMLIAQLATGSKDNKLKAYINFQGGKSNDSGRIYQEDIVLTYAVSRKFSIGYNGTLQSRQPRILEKWETAKSFWGSALYLNADPRDWLKFTLRSEYFSDKNDITGINAGVFETTFSTNLSVGNLVIIPEFRFENAGREIYSKANGTLLNNTGSFLLAAVYHF